MLDPSMQTCKVGAEYRDSHQKLNTGVYEEMLLWALEKIYTSDEERVFLKECIVGRFAPSESPTLSICSAWVLL